MSIVVPPDIVPGVPATFSANATDDHSESLRYQWFEAMVPCTNGDSPPTAPGSTSASTSTFSPTFPMSGDYCVWVTVTDASGAFTTATNGVHVEDRAPQATIKEVLPGVGVPQEPRMTVPLYSDLHFTSSSIDPDQGDDIATANWSSMLDCASQMPGACPGKPADLCFSADQPGECTLVLTVTDQDPEHLSDIARLTFRVSSDRPPCIMDTEPPNDAQLAWNPDDALPVKVTRLDDDGDPLPPPAARPSLASFVWSWRVGTTGGFTRLVDVKQQAYTFPSGSFRVGDIVQIRVEAHDRLDRAGELDACTGAKPEPPPICDPVPSMSCKRWVTWTVEMVL